MDAQDAACLKVRVAGCKSERKDAYFKRYTFWSSLES